tara:strand:+ start:379 stop:762 length:384 start_codon:yes stop_codon:yes gene_type:complete
MFVHKIARPLWLSRRTLYTTSKIENKYHEYVQFAISGTNCLLIVSILGFIEQYKEKMRLIDDCNDKINSLLSYCINEKNILNDGKNLSSEVYNNIADNNVFPIHTADIENNNKIPPIPMFIHDDNDS